MASVYISAVIDVVMMVMMILINNDDDYAMDFGDDMINWLCSCIGIQCLD